MKKIINLIMVTILAIGLLGCADRKEIKGITYGTYGFLNEAEQRNEDICYSVSYGNIFWSIILSETIIMPFYFIGFSIYEPDSECVHGYIKGAVD